MAGGLIVFPETVLFALNGDALNTLVLEWLNCKHALERSSSAYWLGQWGKEMLPRHVCARPDLGNLRAGRGGKDECSA